MSDLVGFGAFSDPIVGGESTLVRDAIRSRNYVPGVSGWSINADGTAELNGVTIRGSGVFGTPGGERVEISNTGIIRIYNAANQLVVQLDDTGLLVQDPDTGAYAQMTLAAGVTVQALQPPAVATYTFGAAFIYGDSDSTLGDAWMRLESPSINGGATSKITMYGRNATNIAFPNSQINLTADDVYTGANFPIGRGPVARAVSAVDSAAVTAETTVLTSTSFSYQPGRAYRAKCGPLVSNSNANGRAGFRIRKDNSAGQILGFGGILPSSPIAGNFCQGTAEFYFRNATANPITCFIALTLQNFDGGANTSQQRVTAGLKRYLTISDVTSDDAFDFATDLV